jgi:hypothetical protein
MRLAFAFFADAATVQEDGTFAVVRGGFDLLLASGALPAIKAAMAMVIRVVASPEEIQHEHELHVEIVSPNGQVILPDARLSFTPVLSARHPERENWMTLCVNYQGVGFPSSGLYTFRISVGDRVIGQVTLEVVASGGTICQPC